MGWFGGSDSGDTSGDTGFASKKKTYDYGDTGSTSTELDLRFVRDDNKFWLKNSKIIRPRTGEHIQFYNPALSTAQSLPGHHQRGQEGARTCRI